LFLTLYLNFQELGEVREQLRDVMFYLEAQNQISRSEHRDEIAEGHIVVAEPPVPPNGGGASGKHRRRKHR
jgi:BRCA1-associated protein